MVRVELFFSPVCPHCPSARKLVSAVAGRYPHVEFVEVNTYTEEGIERGMSMRVLAVPTVAVDDEIKLVGWPFEEKDLVSLIESGL
ncbi:thioredoxin family protein [Candidatus Bathyarchaeota archaeon]|jgi:thioredoxin|nr:thioredoxin family protein [Candidatus Bathyarchaeota archaeon]